MRSRKSLLIALVFSLIWISSLIFNFCQNHDANTTKNYAEEKRLQQHANVTESFVISEHQGIRNHHFSDYAISNDTVFFAYSKGSVIDAYNHNGVFQFAIILPDANNGSVGVRCIGGRLYACAKNDAVYIFEGSNLVDYLTNQQAYNLGYTYQWFHAETDFEIEKSHIYRLDENGNRTSQIETPQIIRNNWPILYIRFETDSFIILIGLLLGIVLFVLLLCMAIKRRVKQSKQPPENGNTLHEHRVQSGNID